MLVSVLFGYPKMKIEEWYFFINVYWSLLRHKPVCLQKNKAFSKNLIGIHKANVEMLDIQAYQGFIFGFWKLDNCEVKVDNAAKMS